MGSLREFGTPPELEDVVNRRAAYALIRAESGAVMAVHGPQNRLFLPGGGCEPGEAPKQALARELLEETGHVLGFCEHRWRVVQHFSADGVVYRMTADLFAASLGRRVERVAEHEAIWVNPTDGKLPWYHASHAWAVAQLVSQTPNLGKGNEPGEESV